MEREPNHSAQEGAQADFFAQIDEHGSANRSWPIGESASESIASTPQRRASERRKKPPKVPTLNDLYLEAQGHYYESVAQELADSGRLGEEGLTDEDLEGYPEFMPVEEFRQTLTERGISFRETEATAPSQQSQPHQPTSPPTEVAAPAETKHDWMREWTTNRDFYDTRCFRPELSVEEMVNPRPLEGWRTVTDEELKALQERGDVTYYAYVNGVKCVRDSYNYHRFKDGSRRITWPLIRRAEGVVDRLRQQGLSDEEIKAAWLTAMPKQFRGWQKYLWDQLNGFYQKVLGDYYQRAHKEQELDELGKKGVEYKERRYFRGWVHNAVREYEWYASYPRLLGEDPKPVPEWLEEVKAYMERVKPKEASG